MTELLKYLSKPYFDNPALLVCWESDAGQIGTKVVEELVTELGGYTFCEIDPTDFFAMGGVAIMNDEVLFPECSFYAVNDRDLVIFSSAIPRSEWYKYLNLVVDVAMNTCNAKELYTIGGMVTLAPHTVSRDFWATFNSREIKMSLTNYQLSREMDFETPPGGRPTLNSFLLWIAKQRGLHGANLWMPIPFYLVDSNDPAAQKAILEFLDSRLDLRLNFARLDSEIMRQNERLERLCQEKPAIGRSIKKLESDIRLSDAEHETLVKEVDEYLRKYDD